jgi:hypothetical protein
VFTTKVRNKEAKNKIQKETNKSKQTQQSGCLGFDELEVLEGHGTFKVISVLNYEHNTPTVFY